MTRVTYDFKFWAELLWGAGIAALIVVLQAFVGTETISDPKAWLVGILGGAGRAAAGYILSRLTAGAIAPGTRA